ncbi:group-specific protein [Evansella tamaricis]|uniref:Group-specific protein n=1 Tax=Evansella tamaricis TaxID=2069301 RepID=A0ABS6JDM6_9BACI|nr:group-specific protein [Evansella tamaricis]MBU9711781.1 group-specific protein [Evansella tamaricis]
MSNCNIDHSLADVKGKLAQQSSYLPGEVLSSITTYLKKGIASQDELNEIFHLLKKYDLSSEDEQMLRDEKLKKY